MDLKHSCIKRLIVGGEDLKTYLAKEIFDAFVGQVEIYNEYGPTETVVGCMIHKYNYETDIKNSVPIGVPADNVQIYVLNKYKEPVYPGGVGEIYIAGDGVARGYLNRPELTTEKFIPCIFNENVRMYKTGDLVRWLPDNTLEYVGRIDQQVKIKGYRIELGEIEARLSTHQEIREVVVVDFKDCSNDIFLCAYYVSNKDLSVPELREYLLKTMPEYMVPAYFVRINEIPVTINGKIDRKQLPEPKVNIATGKKYIEPANPTEKRLALVWQEVLGVDRIGTHDDFFSLGGDSIKAIQISARARKCGLVLDTKDIFDYPTINQICSVVVDLNMQNAEIGEEKEMKLSPSQSEIFNNVGINNKSKYQSVVLRFENGYDKKLLEKAFDQLVRQHEIFKYSFIQKDDELLQVCKSEETFNIEINSLNYDSCVDTDECLRQQIDKLYQDSSLDNEELIKLRIVEFSDKGYLIIALHSLIIDGVSWSIILEDFSQIYSNMLNGKNYSFEYGTGSYRTWYEKLLALANDIELLEESMDYYKKIKEFSEHAHTEDVGIFKDRTAGRGIATMSLTPDVTSMLLENTNAAYNTEPTDLLVAALIKTLGRSTHNNKVILKFGDYPRKNIDDSLDISRTIGCFSPFCPVLFDNVNLDSVPEYIKTTKEIIRRIPMQGFGYGIIKHMKMSDDCIYNSDNEIIVNYYGHIDKYLDKKYFKVHTFDFNLLGLKDYGNNNMLEIDIIILDGKLRVSFNYNQYHYTVESIRDIIKQYESSLVEIINYCVEKKDSEITPSDLLYNELSFDELKEIISDIEDIEI
ncbi:MAG: Gramicidin S synthase 1 [Firmicutes bacterium ADurb.Bin419]|nr:MAG: Gramicidin S synthase 1 [Firmicutes bacterium ADurb.Bin419]